MALKQEINCPLCDSPKSNKLGIVPENLALTMVRCRNCRLVFANPPPTQDELQQLYSPGLVRWTKETDYLPGRELYFRFYASLIGRWNPQSFLDIGCGVGLLGEYVGHILDISDTAGIEISPTDCKIARTRLKTVVCANICQPGVAKLFPFPFETLVMSDVLEHLDKPHVAINNISKMTVVGGILIIDTGNIGGFGPRLAGVKTPFMQDTGHIVFYNPKTITHLLTSHGFEVLEIHQENEVFINNVKEKSSIGTRLKRTFTSSPNMIVVAQKR